MLGSSLGFLKYAMHLVLHFLGSGSVENFRLWEEAYYSMVSIMSCSAVRDGAMAQLSSL